MTWPVHQAVLGAPNVPIHEAGHFVVATAIGLPADWPEVYGKPNAEGANGRVNLRFDLIPKSDKAIEIPDGLYESVGFDLAAVHLAGHCAEAIAKKSHWLCRIIGAGTPDLESAVAILAKTGQEDRLWACWQRSRQILEEHWPMVRGIADQLREETL